MRWENNKKELKKEIKEVRSVSRHQKLMAELILTL